MSMSTPGEMRRPSSKPAQAAAAADDDGKKPSASGGKAGTRTTGKAAGTRPAGAKSDTAKSAGTKSGAAKSGAAKSAGTKSGGARPGAGKPPAKSAGKGGGPRKPVTPVKINQSRNWSLIGLFTAASVLAVGIIAWAGIALWRESNKPTWDERADAIAGIVNFRKENPDLINKTAGHEWGPLTYPQSPPVGGVHNYNWQNCTGNVYTAPIPKEQAVHSLEHGAVWVTYQPNLPQDQVAKLASRVEGVSHVMMSPYDGLDKPISLQAWGYQLKVDNADDKRIDDFITNLRQNAAVEQAGCSEGITDPGTVPIDLGKPPTAPTSGANASAPAPASPATSPAAGG